MQYDKTTNWEKIRDQYDHVIAWGTGSLLQMNYREDYFPLSMVVDGVGSHLGMSFCDLTVCVPDEIRKLKGRLLIVIYTIYESDILNRLQEMDITADTIIYDLLKIHTVREKEFPMWHGKHADDIILVELANRLGIKNLHYLDIGACHPVMRNNTYSLYELGYTGVLVEPNPMFFKLIEYYRPADTLLRCGAGYEDGTLQYYAFPDKPGFGTFHTGLGESRRNMGLQCDMSDIPIIEINKLIDENFELYPNIVDLDAEGIDIPLLQRLDTKKYPIEIFMCETFSIEDKYNKLMYEKGYRRYSNVGENTVYLRTNIIPSGLFAF